MNRTFRSLTLRLLDAVGAKGLLMQAIAAERRIAELQYELKAAREAREPVNAAPRPQESVDAVIGEIERDQLPSPAQFAAACRDYTALRTTAAREAASEHVLTSILSRRDASACDLLADPAVLAHSSHELYRQAKATQSLVTGPAGEAASGWRQVSDDAPSPFNLACYARALMAGGNRRQAFSVLADGVERYPKDVLLARELARFFVRLGDTDAANIALDAVRHTFLDERNALAEQQVALDQVLDEARSADQKHETGASISRHDLWQLQCRQFTQPEFHNPLAAQDAAVRRMVERIVRETGDIARVIELDTLCAETLVRLSRDLKDIECIGIAESQAISMNRALMSDRGPVLLQDDGPSTLASAVAQGRPLILHLGAERFYPTGLTQLYGQCKALGVKHLIVAELVDFDRDSLRYHQAGKYPRVTRLGREGRRLHDLQKLLDGAGYSVAEAEFAALPAIPKRDGSDEDCRLLHAVLRS